MNSAPPKASGPIIFYNTADFCTDFSRDVSVSPARITKNQDTSAFILGASSNAGISLKDGRDPKGPLSLAYTPEEFAQSPQSGDFYKPSAETPWPSSGISEAEPSAAPLPLEVSGLGGVRPDDNFTIEVKTERSLQLSHSRIRYLSCTHKGQPPSGLPPPSYAFVPFSSSGSDSEDSCDLADQESSYESSAGLEHSSYHVPPTYLSTFSTDSGQTSDDPSMNFLAHTKNRHAEVITITETGREQGARDGSAEIECPASSAVATAGALSILDDACPNVRKFESVDRRGHRDGLKESS